MFGGYIIMKEDKRTTKDTDKELQEAKKRILQLEMEQELLKNAISYLEKVDKKHPCNHGA